ncbi:hypothetical protein BABINDRAFT_165837 [Babjeviella inositovora NRRL Y-12698]|uniref:Nucleoporin Nup133/Nup155-like C-terminal domain-containing protein n=1 Tax=Babjeviella inositovora NRRL Y-12698 TaxID=984486 RepID=A0A1E3QTW6_9ASCO|nr:uncharacterized protein BABINDRAFT_165837 [Babjeviella inositovora NRRL Y-12698]ODQ81128.1 hypothetical protein BABINDRAFT_165837 [Babjeviella inositovora NRRL Y-12698]
MSFIFSARKAHGPSVEADTSANHTVESVSQTQDLSSSGVTELTKNDKYCVSRLPAVPPALKQQDFSHGYTDQTTSHAVIVSETSVYVWDYTSVDGVPLTISFPVTPNPNNTLPLAILVAPSAGSSDPGLVIIDSYSGRVKYYEAITAAPALGIINSKSIEYHLGLQNEYIHLAENIEPAGIMVATNAGRVMLVSLRDSQGRPNLTKVEVMRARGSLFGWIARKTEPQIVAMRAGKILAQGTREVVIQDSIGDFHRFACSRSGAHKLAATTLAPQCLKAIDGYLPGAEVKLQILDIQSLPIADDLYLVLASTAKPYEIAQRTLIVFTMKIDATGALVYSSQRITSYACGEHESVKLFLPQPFTTAYIVTSSSVILTDVLTSVDPESVPSHKWEDLISFQRSVRLLGVGAEDVLVDSKSGKISRNSGLVLITSNAGIIRVERFHESSVAADLVSPVQLVKSHIEQAVYYGSVEANPIEFAYQCDTEIAGAVFEQAITLVTREIVQNSSKYIPPFSPSLKDHLARRREALSRLVLYVAHNFSSIPTDVKLVVVTSLEKVAVGAAFWSFIESRQETSAVLEAVIKDTLPASLNDVIRTFFMKGLENVNAVLSGFLKACLAKKVDTAALSLLVVDVLQAIYETEEQYRFGVLQLASTDVGSQNMWVFETRLVFQVDSIFEKMVETYRVTDIKDVNALMLIKHHLTVFTQALFYLFDNAVTFMQLKGCDAETMKEYVGYYEDRKPYWINALVEFDGKPEALRLCETYGDFKSLAKISDDDRQMVISKFGRDSSEFETISSRFDYFFEKFGYAFAKDLYTYYFVNDKLQTLLTAFPEYFEFLRRYLDEGNHGKLSWVRDVLDARYVEAAVAITKVVQVDDNSQKHRKLQLSVAKLALLAAEDASSDAEAMYENTSKELELISIQQSLYGQFSQLVNKSNTARDVEFVVANFTNRLQEAKHLHSVVILRKALGRLMANRSLEVDELIDCYTLLDAQKAGPSRDNLYWALKLVSMKHYTTMDEKRLDERLVWARLLAVDDWETLTVTANKSDEYVKQSLQGTVFYNTMTLLFKDGAARDGIDLDRLLNLLQVFGTPILRNQLLGRYSFLDSQDLTGLGDEIAQDEKKVQQCLLGDCVKSLVSAASQSV